LAKVPKPIIQSVRHNLDAKMDMFHVVVVPPIVWTCLAANLIVGGERGQDPLLNFLIVIILIDVHWVLIVLEAGYVVIHPEIKKTIKSRGNKDHRFLRVK
jgi:hypothetical protein